jgi:hypothetical protein
VRVECPSCHQVVNPALAINSADVGMTCPSCGKHIAKDALAAAETDDDLKTTTPIPSTKAKVCAKCGTQLREGAEACPSCGLAVAKMATFSGREDTVPAALKAAWEGVVAVWNDEAKHDALFKLVAESGEYSWAAAKYREQARARPGDPIVTKQQDKLKRALEAQLMISSSKKDKPGATPYKSTVTMLGVLIILLVVGVFYMIVKSKSHQDEAPPEPPPPPGATPGVR